MYSNLNTKTKILYSLIIPLVIFLIYIVISSFSTYFYYNKEVMENNQILKKLISLIFYLCAFMTIYCYILSILTDPGTINDDKLKLLEKDDKTYCKKCDKERPIRAHHCSTCNKCFLKLDHHCPWIFNCVGYYNQKIFLLFLFYGLIGNLIAFFCIISRIFDPSFKKIIINSFELVDDNEDYFIFKLLILLKHPLWIILSTIISFALSLSFSILLYNQLINIIYNITHVEYLIYDTNEECPFYAEKGYRYLMFKSVVGLKEKWKWFLPIFEENKYNDGYCFETPYQRFVKEKNYKRKIKKKSFWKDCFCWII
jgi:hypothetical protein